MDRATAWNQMDQLTRYVSEQELATPELFCDWGFSGQLNASQRLHLRPINDIVYVEPYSIKDERSYLRGSFTLRCFQRLSRPDVATQLCPWQDN